MAETSLLKCLRDPFKNKYSIILFFLSVLNFSLYMPLLAQGQNKRGQKFNEGKNQPASMTV
jgi:hypothetical protein